MRFCLGLLLDDDELTARAIRWLPTTDYRLVLVDDALGESIAHGGDVHAHKRARNLGRMDSELGGARVALATPMVRLMRREKRGPYHGQTPVRPDGRVRQIARLAQDEPRFREWHAVAKKASDAFFAKDRWLSLDRELGEKLGSDLDVTPDELGRFMRAFGSRMDEGHVALKGFIPDETVRRRVLADKKGHRASIAGAALFQLNMLGSMLRSRDRGEEFGWLTSERGNYTDARIAANLACCDVFVVDERRLRGKLTFLAAQGLWWAKVVSLTELLGTVQESPTSI